MVQLEISNSTDTDMRIVIDTSYALDISNKLTNRGNLIFLLDDFIESDFVGGDNFPQILFTDSADNLSKYNSEFLSNDDSESKGIHKIPKRNVAKARTIWTVLPMYIPLLEDSNNIRKGKLYFRFPCDNIKTHDLYRELSGSEKFSTLLLGR